MINGKIIKINPVSVYEDKVYTQDVLVELENKITINLFDPAKRCKEGMIGKKKEIKVHASSVPPIKRNQEKEIGILPVEKDQGPHADIKARIKKIIPDKP